MLLSRLKNEGSNRSVDKELAFLHDDDAQVLFVNYKKVHETSLNVLVGCVIKLGLLL